MMQDYDKPLDAQAPHSEPEGKERQAAFWKFLLCSAFGVLLFIVPISWNGKITILLGVLGDSLKTALGQGVFAAALGVISLSFLGAALVKIFRPNLQHYPHLKKWFDVTWAWFVIRLLGFVFIWMYHLQKGPQWVIDRNTGGVIYEDLLPILLPLWIFAFLLLPLLTDYGLMEYIGTLVRKVFMKCFRIPGRAAIDAISSWFGVGSIGLLVTMQQYDKGYYSRREASIVATSFSITSIAFTYVVAKTLKVEDKFILFYLTVSLVGFLLAIIMPRIPPLSLKPDSYHLGKKQLNEDIPKNRSLSSWALGQAITRAHIMPPTRQVFKDSTINLVDIYLAIIPAIFALGTIGLALTEFTGIFKWLSMPFVPLLELLHIPHAIQAAPALLVGFADMFLPALVGNKIDSEITRFVIGVVSIIQVIYMSEIGALILKSNFRMNVLELFIIFLLRTLIALPIIAGIAHLIYL